MDKFDGYLFSKLHLIGTKSEGPEYILQCFNYSELPIVKKTNLWEQDPALHNFLGKKITIEGKTTNSGIEYKKISDYKVTRNKADKEPLDVDLKLESEILWVNKQPGVNSISQQSFQLSLLVKYPLRGMWNGITSTSQIYDFIIEYKDKTIWRWSEGKQFLQYNMPIQLIGGHIYEYPESWVFNPKTIESEGTYTVRGIFIASRQEIVKKFQVKFAF